MLKARGLENFEDFSVKQQKVMQSYISLLTITVHICLAVTSCQITSFEIAENLCINCKWSFIDGLKTIAVKGNFFLREYFIIWALCTYLEDT